jgi:hypothetical protein
VFVIPQAICGFRDNEPTSHEIFFFGLTLCPGQLAHTSTNFMNSEVNNHVSLQWPSYEQPQAQT